jgi:hypothetical protein
MKIKLNCPYAKHEPGTMRVICKKVNGYCAHQYYKRCKGWWTLTDQAKDCPVKEAEQ